MANYKASQPVSSIYGRGSRQRTVDNTWGAPPLLLLFWAVALLSGCKGQRTVLSSLQLIKTLPLSSSSTNSSTNPSASSRHLSWAGDSGSGGRLSAYYTPLYLRLTCVPVAAEVLESNSTQQLQFVELMRTTIASSLGMRRADSPFEPDVSRVSIAVVSTSDGDGKNSSSSSSSGNATIGVGGGASKSGSSSGGNSSDDGGGSSIGRSSSSGSSSGGSSDIGGSSRNSSSSEGDCTPDARSSGNPAGSSSGLRIATRKLLNRADSPGADNASHTMEGNTSGGSSRGSRSSSGVGNGGRSSPLLAAAAQPSLRGTTHNSSIDSKSDSSKSDSNKSDSSRSDSSSSGRGNRSNRSSSKSSNARSSGGTLVLDAYLQLAPAINTAGIELLKVQLAATPGLLLQDDPALAALLTRVDLLQPAAGAQDVIQQQQQLQQQQQQEQQPAGETQNAPACCLDGQAAATQLGARLGRAGAEAGGTPFGARSAMNISGISLGLLIAMGAMLLGLVAWRLGARATRSLRERREREARLREEAALRGLTEAQEPPGRITIWALL